MIPHPIEFHADPGAAWTFMAVGAAFFLASAAWALRESLRHRNALAWLALLGGAIASLEESWIDHIIQLWYPYDSPWILFEGMGTPQPLYIHLIYPGFIGLGAYATYLGLRRDPGGRMLWPTFVAIMVMDLLFEGGATSAHVFYYYGPQPFQLVHDGWPAWVAPINAAGPMAAGWLMYRLEPTLRGARRLLFALLPPLAYTGVYGAASWPTHLLMNSGAAAAAIWAAAVVTMLLAVLVVHFIRASLPGTALAAEGGGARLMASAN